MQWLTRSIRPPHACLASELVGLVTHKSIANPKHTSRFLNSHSHACLPPTFMSIFSWIEGCPHIRVHHSVTNKALGSIPSHQYAEIPF